MSKVFCPYAIDSTLERLLLLLLLFVFPTRNREKIINDLMGKPVGNKSNQNVGVGRRQFLKVITITTGDQGVVCNGSVTLTQNTRCFGATKSLIWTGMDKNNSPSTNHLTMQLNKVIFNCRLCVREHVITGC